MKLISSFLRSLDDFVEYAVPAGSQAGSAWALNRPRATVDILLLDTSGSMENNDYLPSRVVGAKKSADGFLAKRLQSDPAAYVGLVSFADDARIICPPLLIHTGLEQLKQAVKNLETGCATNMSAGLACAADIIKANPNCRSPRIVLLTDGHASSDVDPVVTAGKIKEQGVQLDIIGIGGSPGDVDEATLRRMASVVKGETQYWFIKSVGDLIRRFEFLGLRKCS